MNDKGTIFYESRTLNLKGKLFSLEKPIVQGILNVTPDSFYDGGCYDSLSFALFQCEKMLKAGASIIDIGGQSTRPNAKLISEEKELKRVVPIIIELTKHFPKAIFSIDTFRSKVARECIEGGAHIVNDVSGGSLDAKMFETVGELGVPYILMHSKGNSQTMDQNINYENFLVDISTYFEERINKLKAFGVKDIILDVGFGFAKTLNQNYYLMKYLESFKLFELPMLVGISRKKMIYDYLEITSEKALTGTIALNTFALEKGASILRVHDVKEAMETIEIYQKIKNVSI